MRLGFGTYQGNVIAAKKWGDPPEVMTVPKGTVGSWEDALHHTGLGNQYLVFTEERETGGRFSCFPKFYQFLFK